MPSHLFPQRWNEPEQAMSYTKLATQPPNLTLTIVLDGTANTAPATAVELDTGDIIAVGAVSAIALNSGNPTICAMACAITADGTQRFDALGQPLQSQFTHTTSQSEITQVGSIDAVQKCALMAVLGESTAPLWQDPIHATALQNASIRINLASSTHAGPVNASGLL